MAKRRITIDFYRVRMPGDVPVPFEPCIYNVAKSKNDDGRNVVFAGDPIRLHSAQKWDECCEGEMTRIRMDDLPSKASLSGAVEALDLGDDEGIGEQAAFLYHPATQTLLMQRNRSSVSPRALAFYFGEKSGLHDPIFLDPVLTSDAVKRLASMQTITKFRVRVAKVNNAKLFEQGGESLGGMIELLEDFAAPNLEFAVSMGRKRHGSLAATVKQTAMNLLGIGNSGKHNRVTAVELVGRTEDGERDELDLIEQQMSQTALIETDDRRRMLYRERQNALREAFKRRVEELRQMFK